MLGRRASSASVLSIAEIQELADQVHALAKPLAGLEPQIEARIFVANKSGGDLTAANKILGKIKAGWKPWTYGPPVASCFLRT
jgi:hypothetical protein